MEEMSKHGRIGVAAMRSGMDRKTARKYVEAGRLPSELKGPRGYRTRPDPFVEDWQWVAEQLQNAPALEAKTLFEALQERRPGRYQDGQLRTLQRHIKQWRAVQGPDREVFFPQGHRPGEAMQVDFTYATELGVTIAGGPFVHMLCQVVLPYSNWQSVTVCLSESFLALRRGVQQAVFRLGRVPQYLQSDNTTAATHDLSNGKRDFNDDYASFARHLGMAPRTIGIGKKEQNGDVEASHRVLKRRLEQAMLLRGSRDFASVEQYEQWLSTIGDNANRSRQVRLAEELAAMRPVSAARLPDFVEMDVVVTSWSTIRVKFCTYSVPSRLIGERVRVRLFERRLEVYYGGQRQFEVERLKGRHRHRINYRHVIWSLVRKPGAFARYRYRDELFPTAVFRRAYDSICQSMPDVRGDLEYLRILHLAAATMEVDVEAALECLLETEQSLDADRVRSLVAGDEIVVPELAELQPCIDSYDELLKEVGA